ncbi:site-2 protease family protein, partial [Candidatus Calescamantes bacterium]|nr:site-2 protease family protein [Candidatus Calescamantes bacterium]
MIAAIAIILGIAAMILIHELGHFVAARAFGIEVEEFSIGFGPALFKKKKGNTLY